MTASALTVVGAFLKQWLKDRAPAGSTPSTLEKYRLIIDKQLDPAFGSYKLEKLTLAHVQSVCTRWLSCGRLDKRSGGLSAATVRKYHSVLRSALQYALDQGLVVRNVARGVQLPSLQSSAKRALDPAQCQNLLNAAEGTDLHSIILVALGTGMRRGELLALRWTDVDFNRGVISVRRSLESSGAGGLRFKKPKSGNERTFEAPQMVLEELERHRMVQGQRKWNPDKEYRDQDLVFATEQGDTMSPAALSGAFRRLAKRAKLGSIGPHTLRHTATTRMLEIGINPKAAADILGHSTARITLETYTHVTASMLSDAAARIDQTLRGLTEGKTTK